ncbi:MAG: hypothetical protein PVG22_11025 [Chromatiales bacterium]|jgi:hypothetical protein
MKLGLVLSFGLLLAITSTHYGASLIELQDGTRIVGEVVSAEQGHYLIRSTNLGEIRLDESAIRSIHPSTDAQAYSAEPVEMDLIQQKIANSPELMKMITDLQTKPQLLAILNDKQLLQLVLSGDIESLQQDPRIMQLLADPSMQAIIDKVMGE